MDPHNRTTLLITFAPGFSLSASYNHALRLEETSKLWKFKVFITATLSHDSSNIIHHMKMFTTVC